MRILMVGPLARAGGVGIHTRYLTGALRDAGINVILYDSNFEAALPKLIIDVVKVYKRTLGMLLFSMKNKNRFDVVHVQASGGAGFLNAITGAIFAPLWRGKGFVVTFHRGEAKKFIKKYRKVIEFVLRRADKMILVSGRQRGAFNEIFPDSTNIRVISNGYSSDFKRLPMNDARRDLKLPIDKKIVLSVGSLEPVKGHKYLIHAINFISRKDDDTICLIVGSGSQERDLADLIGTLHLEECIKLVGSRPHEEIPIWMNACNVFVLPSLSEGNPTVMFEALGCGKPFVGTNVGGIPEIIRDERLGILVEPRDEDGLAEALLLALDKEWDAEYILDCAEQFTWKRIAERTMEVYEDVLWGKERSWMMSG